MAPKRLLYASIIIWLFNQSMQSGQWTDLKRAIKFGDISQIKQELKNGAHVNSLDNIRATPLMTAIFHPQSNLLNVVQELIDYGADPNICTNENWCSIHVAAEDGNTKLVEVLFNAGANLNVQYMDGASPLIVAIYNNRTETAEKLIALGSTTLINLCKKDGWCPLHAAIEKCNKPVVDSLLSRTLNNVDESYFVKYNIHDLLALHKCSEDLTKLVKIKLYPASPAFRSLLSFERRSEKILQQKLLKLEKLYSTLESIIDKSPIYYTLAKILLEQGDYEKALDNIEQAIRIEEKVAFEPINGLMHELKVEILLRKKDYQSAYKILCKNKLESTKARILLAWSEVSLGRISSAEANIEKARRVIENDEELLYTALVLGEINAQKNDSVRAFNNYVEAEQSLKKMDFKIDLYGYTLERLVITARKCQKFAEAEHYLLEYEKIFGRLNDRAMRMSMLSE